MPSKHKYNLFFFLLQFSEMGLHAEFLTSYYNEPYIHFCNICCLVEWAFMLNALENEFDSRL